MARTLSWTRRSADLLAAVPEAFKPTPAAPRWHTAVRAAALLAGLLAVILAPPHFARTRDRLGAFRGAALAGGARWLTAWTRDGGLDGLRVTGGASPVAAAPARGVVWKRLARGIRWRAVDVDGATRMQQVEVDLAQARLQVLYARDFGMTHAAVPDLARRAHALAAVNACYFDDRSRPLGYLKLGGRVVNRDLATGNAFTGVFTMRGRTARIVSRNDFNPRRADTALQAGPRLVADGRPTAGLLETRSFRQSGIAVTRSGRVVIYATDGPYTGLTWERTRRILLGPAARGGVAPRDVLNLDGGSSSQIYVAVPGQASVETGFPTAVPVALGILP